MNTSILVFFLFHVCNSLLLQGEICLPLSSVHLLFAQLPIYNQPLNPNGSLTVLGHLLCVGSTFHWPVSTPLSCLPLLGFNHSSSHHYCLATFLLGLSSQPSHTFPSSLLTQGFRLNFQGRKKEKRKEDLFLLLNLVLWLPLWKCISLCCYAL